MELFSYLMNDISAAFVPFKTKPQPRTEELSINAEQYTSP
jgi:hypothetical protein